MAFSRIDPDGAARRHEERRRDRRVELQADDDAMAWLSAYLAYHQAAAIYEKINCAARPPRRPMTIAPPTSDAPTRSLT